MWGEDPGSARPCSSDGRAGRGLPSSFVAARERKSDLQDMRKGSDFKAGLRCGAVVEQGKFWCFCSSCVDFLAGFGWADVNGSEQSKTA